MINEFLHIAKSLNRLDITPLLYGSLGLEQRLGTYLNADDIDILIPQIYLNENWCIIEKAMNDIGYSLYDLHEHAFEKYGTSAAFASLEELSVFADVNIDNIPLINENGITYHLLELNDYLKVYTASSKDGYRRDTKNKNDKEKILLIKKHLM